MNYREYSLYLWNNRQTTCPTEWQVVLCFYAALHATNSFCYSIGATAPTSHNVHKKNLQNKGFSLLSDYQALQELSEQVRYSPQNPILPAKIKEAERLALAILTHINII
jgi:hypothetical protein